MIAKTLSDAGEDRLKRIRQRNKEHEKKHEETRKYNENGGLSVFGATYFLLLVIDRRDEEIAALEKALEEKQKDDRIQTQRGAGRFRG